MRILGLIFCFSPRALLLCLLPVVMGLWASAAQAEEFHVDYKADRVEYVESTGVFKLLGNVFLTVKELEPKAGQSSCKAIERTPPEIGDEATMQAAKTAFQNQCVKREFQIQTERLDYNQKLKRLETPESFNLEQLPIKDGDKKRTLKGASLIYDFGLRRIEARDVYLVMEAQMPGHEVYIQGELMTAFNDGQRVVFTHGFYTTCNHVENVDFVDGEDPYSREAVQRRTTHYAIDAEILDFVQGDRLLAWNADIMSFENQAFWFPFWYIPLTSEGFGIQKPDLDYGQNPIEGNFLRFKNYYQINEYHDGYLYMSVMENKGVGLGFQHDWIAYPNSISRLYFYGIPVTTDLFDVPGALFRGATAQQQQAALTTQQIPSNGFFAAADDWLRNKFQDYHIKFEHRQRLLPHTEATIAYEDRDFYNVSAFTAARNPVRSFSLNLDDKQIFALDPYNDLNVTTNLKLGQTNNQTVNESLQQNGNVTVSRTTDIRNSQNQERSARINTRLDKSTLNFSSNWRNNSNNNVTVVENFVDNSRNQTPTPGSAGENWGNTLDFKTQIDEKTSLSTNLVYNSILSGVTAGNSGTLRQTLQPRINLTQNHSWGSAALSYIDFFDFSPTANNNNSQVKKLPEFAFKFNPFFRETFPVNFETTIGRYFEQAAVIENESLNEIGRGKFKLSLGSKEHDLGLGMKANYSGTSFEQRFYQTLDAEYIFTGQVSLKNDLSPYFVPSFTYSRAIVDVEDNNSPFQSFEPLALQLRNNLRAQIGLVNLPEMTLTLSGGYDYLNQTYQQFQASMRSQIANQFTLTAQTSYQPITIRSSDVGQPLKDISGNEYKHPNPLVTDLTVTEDMVGSLSALGGRWGNTTLAMRWRNVPYDLNFGNLNTFGLEEGVPNGFELGTGVAWDPHQGRFNSLNALARIKLGEDWLWHTEIDFEIAVQPFNVPEQSTSFVDFVGSLQYPFKVTVRKDLHDFVLTASWDSFYQQFNLNLALLAFPYDTGDLLSNVGSLNNQLNTTTNQLNTNANQLNQPR